MRHIIQEHVGSSEVAQHLLATSHMTMYMHTVSLYVYVGLKEMNQLRQLQRLYVLLELCIGFCFPRHTDHTRLHNFTSLFSKSSALHGRFGCAIHDQFGLLQLTNYLDVTLLAQDLGACCFILILLALGKPLPEL